MSQLYDWLFDKTPGIEDDAPKPPAFLQETGCLPEQDDDLETLGHDPIPLEEVFTVIDYRGANGSASRRRITFRTLAPGPHAPILRAICHERKAIRSFRCDRIQGFIEDDGVVLDCETFFREIMLIDLGPLDGDNAARQTPTALGEARRIRDKLRAPLSILVAIARSDKDFALSELNVICQWIAACSPEALLPTHPGDLDPMSELRALVRKMRPTRESLQGYLDKTREIANREPAFIEPFEETVEKVVWADGRLARREAALLEELGITLA